MPSKADYVRAQRQTRLHHCHWPGCDKQVPPAMWGCSPHWFSLPKALRSKVWAAYRPGQEVNGTPSAAYIHVAKEVQAWILEQQRCAKTRGSTSIRELTEGKKGPNDRTGTAGA